MTKALTETATKLVPLAELIPDPQHVARHSPDQTKHLAGDMAANGLHQAIGILADRRIIYGHGRYLAAKALGWKEIEAKVYPDSLTETQWRIIRATENLQRTDLTGFQKWQLSEELVRLNPSWKGIDLADHLHVDPGMITRLLSPSRCIPAIQEALKGGLLTIEDCYAASRMPETGQHDYLAARRNGSSAATVLRQVRQSQNGNGHAVKVSRAKCATRRACVTLVAEGEAMSLDDIIETLLELLKEAKKANDQGLDAKTFQAVLRDKANAG